MSKIRKDLVGTVHAISQARERVILKAGDKIPDGFFVGGHVVEGGDPADQIPPWSNTTAIVSADAAAGAGEVPALTTVLDSLVADGAEPEELLAFVAGHLGIEPSGGGSGSQEPSGDETGTGTPGGEESAAAGSTQSEDATLVVPPKTGAGSSTEAWRDYAEKATKAAGLNLDIADDATRGDIIAALDEAKIATA